MWVGDWTNCNILTPSSFVFRSTSFSFIWTAQLPIALCWVLVLSTAPYLQLTDSKLTERPVAPGYIIVWRTPASCERHICIQFNPSTVKAISWCLRPDAPVSRLTARSKVNMLHKYFCYIRNNLNWNIPKFYLTNRWDINKFYLSGSL